LLTYPSYAETLAPEIQMRSSSTERLFWQPFDFEAVRQGFCASSAPILCM